MSIFQSNYFDLQELAAGVYAAIAKENSGAASNAGLVDLGDRTLVFDTFLIPAAAADLRAAAVRLTGRAPATIINSHWHSDHIRGNQVFAVGELRSHLHTATIIATPRTYELMATTGVERLAWEQANAPGLLAEKEAQLAATTDAATRQALAAELAHFRPVVAALPEVTPRLPHQTFERRLTGHGSRRMVEIITFGGGHTDSDAILYLPDDGLAFVADLLFVGCHPWLGNGHPEEWIRILDELKELPVTTYVGGHGPPGTKEDLSLIQRYIPALAELAAEVAANGGSADDAAVQPVPAPLAGLANLLDTYASNMRFLYGRATQPT